MARTPLIPHLTTSEIEAALHQCEDAALRMRIAAIRLVSMGWSYVGVGEALGHPRGWVSRWVQRFNSGGILGLEDGRQHNGRDAHVSEAVQAELTNALSAPHADGGLWNGNKVRRWLAPRMEKPPGKRLGWRYLKKNNYSLQRPQTRHAKADPAQQEEFKKK